MCHSEARNNTQECKLVAYKVTHSSIAAASKSHRTAFVYQNTYISGDINSIGGVRKNYLTLNAVF